MRRSSFKLLLLSLLAAFGWAASLRAQSIITTIAGGGPASFMGNGGPATLSSLGGPDDIALDSHGNLFIADPGYLLIRKVDMSTGIITTVAGDGTFNPGYSGDGGPATLAEFNYPSGIAFDSHDNMYISDYYNSVIRRVDAVTGIITTVVGTGVGGYSGDGGPATQATLNAPLRLRFDPNGDLLIADSMNGAIRRVNMTTGIITTYAGTGTLGYTGDGGPATQAQMAEPQGMDFDSSGNLYVTDSDNHVVRRIDKTTGVITTIAGNGSVGYSGDGGPATLASFSMEPDGILVGCNNNIYVTDDLNNSIRVISGTTGIITTMAGDVTISGGVTTGIPGHSGDGGPALGAKLDHPEALIFGSQGSMLVADYIEGYIRQISVACALTPTWTPTFSPTPTVTPTQTPSSTPSPTKTYTPTPTFTPTPTDTPTPTNSPTITPTPTSTWTPTSTGTPTPSGTPTATGTSTASSTPTLTFTSTWTATATPTATWAVSLGKQASKTEAESGDTVTYTLAVTVGTGSLTQPIVIDTLPVGLIFLNLGTVSNGTAQYIPSLNQVQWTLSSPLGPGAYSLTYQTQLKPFAPADQDLINNAQLTYSGAAQPLRASAVVHVPGVYTVRIGIYNEAGEWIQDLTSFRSTQPVNSLDLVGGPITHLTGNGNHIDLYSQGSYLATWNGLTAQGDPLTNGVYQIKVENVDSYGSVTTVTRGAVISRTLARVMVQVFNEAGETVKHLFAYADDADGAQMTNLTLSSSVVDPHPSGGSNSGVTLVVDTSSSSVTLTWDGTNDAGALVSAGHYEILAHWADGKGGSSDITRGILVAPHGDLALNWIWAQPNHLPNPAGDTHAVFSSNHSDWSLTIRIYDLAGELVVERKGLPGTADTTWDTSNSASGLYLAHVEGHNAQGGLEGAQTLKILVVH